MSGQEESPAKACQSVELHEELARHLPVEVHRLNCLGRNMSHLPLQSCTWGEKKLFTFPTKEMQLVSVSCKCANSVLKIILGKGRAVYVWKQKADASA